MDRWMVIIGHRSSKSTFGANDVHDIYEKYFFRYLHMMMTWKMMVWSRVCKDLVIAAFEQVGPTQEDYRPGALQLLKGGWWRASSSTTPSSSSPLSSSLLSSSLLLPLRSCQEGRQGALQLLKGWWWKTFSSPSPSWSCLEDQRGALQPKKGGWRRPFHHQYQRHWPLIPNFKVICYNIIVDCK